MTRKILLYVLVIGVLFLFFMESSVLAYIKWEIVLSPNTTNSWESFVVYPPYIMYDYQDSIYKMWYSSRGPNSGIGLKAASGINYATSLDGVNWVNRDSIQGQVYTTPTYYQITYPWIIKSGNMYKIWHRHYYNGSCGGWDSYINYCESPDGINWGPETSNFLCAEYWEDNMSGGLGSIVQKGDSTFLYYDAHPPDHKTAIGRAVSLDSGRTWIDPTRTMIIHPDSVKLCDSLFNYVGEPNVTLKEDGMYRMYFGVGYPSWVPYPVSNYTNYIYEGKSQDGLYWNPDSLTPFLAPYMLGGTITGVRWPFYFKDKDGKEYLYFAFIDTTYIPTSVPNPPDFGIRIGRALLNNIVNGDANCDSIVSVSDVIYIINYLFRGGPPPHTCMSADVNGDGVITISDVVYLINYLFKGGRKPAIGCVKSC